MVPGPKLTKLFEEQAERELLAKKQQKSLNNTQQQVQTEASKALVQTSKNMNGQTLLVFEGNTFALKQVAELGAKAEGTEGEIALSRNLLSREASVSKSVLGPQESWVLLQDTNDLVFMKNYGVLAPSQNEARALSISEKARPDPIVIRTTQFQLQEGESIYTDGRDLIVIAHQIEINGMISTQPFAPNPFTQKGQPAGDIRLLADTIRFGSEAQLNARGGVAGTPDCLEDLQLHYEAKRDEILRDLKQDYVEAHTVPGKIRSGSRVDSPQGKGIYFILDLPPEFEDDLANTSWINKNNSNENLIAVTSEQYLNNQKIHIQEGLKLILEEAQNLYTANQDGFTFENSPLKKEIDWLNGRIGSNDQTWLHYFLNSYYFRDQMGQGGGPRTDSLFIGGDGARIHIEVELLKYSEALKQELKTNPPFYSIPKTEIVLEGSLPVGEPGDIEIRAGSEIIGDQHRLDSSAGNTTHSFIVDWNQKIADDSTLKDAVFEKRSSDDHLWQLNLENSLEYRILLHAQDFRTDTIIGSLTGNWQALGSPSTSSYAIKAVYEPSHTREIDVVHCSVEDLIRDDRDQPLDKTAVVKINQHKHLPERIAELGFDEQMIPAYFKTMAEADVLTDEDRARLNE